MIFTGEIVWIGAIELVCVFPGELVKNFIANFVG